MNNAIMVLIDKHPFAVILVPDMNCMTVELALDDYASWCGLNRAIMTGYRINVVDITSEYPDRKPHCKGEWPK